MYSPEPFLISSAALTSIFSFFFGGYFKEREKAYQLWIRFIGYEAVMDDESEAKQLCAELESKERVFRQAKGLLKILFLTVLADCLVFHWYSYKYIHPGSLFFEPDAFHSYIGFSSIIGIIVLINCIELLYIEVAFGRKKRFPFWRFRHRVTGQDRVSELWQLINCPALKEESFNKHRIPERFYDDLEQSG
ncbi:MAG: hypothetical protein OEL55_00310 [Desulfobulbaceae bacterium]|nr:hypothetical protein [Desulfobulbaceae bacterium]